jgi:hypothetical protein
MNARTPKSAELLQAEKQVVAGVYGRLLDRYRDKFGNDASTLARVVAASLFGQTLQDKLMAELIASRKDLVEREVARLKEDLEIRRIVTDTLVLKAVFLHRQRSCKDGSHVDPIERLKQLGIYLEGKKPPTPMSFIISAREFFSTTPRQKAGIVHE